MALISHVSPISKSKTLNQEVDGLLSDVKWASYTISFSFPDDPTDYGKNYASNEPSKNFVPFNPAEQEAVRSILIYKIAAVTDLTFVEYPEAGYSDGDTVIRLAKMDMSSEAWAYLPETPPEGGDAWFSNSLFGSSLADKPPVVVGSYNYTVLMHELGHSLGLEHSFQGGKFGQTPNDSLEYSVMSYSSYEGAKGWYAPEGDYPQTLMMYDIAALQYMYGANTPNNSGNTVYKWDPVTGALSINDCTVDGSNTDTIFMTIWDGGGIDTYDFSNYGTEEGCTIDLRPGEWTTVSSHQLSDLDGTAGNHNAEGNIANSLAVGSDGKPVGLNGTAVNLIENVIGSQNSDKITGNYAANSIWGGAGDDIMDGGAGSDTFVFTPGFGHDTIVGFDADPTNGQDLLEFVGFAETNLNIISQGTDSLVQVGFDFILLVGVAGSTLTQDDYLLA